MLMYNCGNKFAVKGFLSKITLSRKPISIPTKNH